MRKSKLLRAWVLLRRGNVLQAAARHLKHKLEKRQAKLVPAVPISEVVPEHQKAVILDSPNAALNGNVSPAELETLCRVVGHFQPENMFEIGTFDGRTTVHLAANSGEKAKVFTLDLPQENVNETELRIKASDTTFIEKEISGREFLGRKREGEKITHLFGDSATFDYSPFQERMDFVFVDGSHSYEYVVNDTQVALKLLRGGKGIIMWHDYGWREVVRALNEFYEGHPLLGNLQHIEGTSLVFSRQT